MKRKVFGFTVIEVMLAISISLALTAILMQSINVSINRQRYHDAVMSFQDYLRGQYNQVNNVVVSKTNDHSNAEIQEITSNSCAESSFYGAGRSNCVLIGRLIQLDNRDDIGIAKEYRVFYYQNDAIGAQNFENYFDSQNQANQETINFFDSKIKLSDKSSESSLEWAASFRTTENNPLQATILIIKSPNDGTVRTYSDYGIKTISQIAGINNQLDFCIKSSGNPYGPRRAVRLNSRAANSSAVETMPIGDGEREVRCQR